MFGDEFTMGYCIERFLRLRACTNFVPTEGVNLKGVRLHGVRPSLRARFGEGLGGAHRREPAGRSCGRDRTLVTYALTASRAVPACFLATIAEFVPSSTAQAKTWHGLAAAPEFHCSSYGRQRDYRYPQSIKREIVHRLGPVHGPYTGTCFAATSETDIEHIVAMSEAHDSGLCVRRRVTRARFAATTRCTAACATGTASSASDHISQRPNSIRSQCATPPIDWEILRFRETRNTYVWQAY